MPQPLPDGYVDTGIRLTWVCMLQADVFRNGIARFGLIHGYSDPVVANDPAWVTWLVQQEGIFSPKVRIDHPNGTTYYLDGVESYGAAYRVELGPLRLGQHTTHQNVWPGNQLRYAWFADADTKAVETFGPYRYVYYPLNLQTSRETPPAPTAGPQRWEQWFFRAFFSTWSGMGSNTGDVLARLSAVTLDGAALDCADLILPYADPGPTADPVVRGSGSTIDYLRAAAGGSHAVWFGPPLQLAYNLDVTKNGQASWDTPLLDAFLTVRKTQAYAGRRTAKGTIKTPDVPDLRPPYSGEWSLPNVSWWEQAGVKTTPEFRSALLSFSLDTDPATDPNVSGWDYRVPIYAIMPRQDPAGGAGRSLLSYEPASIRFEATRNVHRPNGNTPSAWTPNDPAKGSVTENASESRLQVDDTSVVFTRTFSTLWRPRCGLGAQGAADPLYDRTAYRVTKHNYYGAGDQEDVYGWESYAFLRVALDAPAASNLTLTVEGVALAVSDPHNGGNPTITEHPFTRTYALTVALGANTVELDLLFPNEGGPFYVGRVDRLKFSGFAATGEYVLTGLTLFAKTTPDAQGYVYLKWNPGPPIAEPDEDAPLFETGFTDYGGWVPAVDGAFPLEHWADRLYQRDQDGQWGGAPRWMNAERRYQQTLTSENFILPHTVEEFVEHLDRKEGWTGSYDAAAFNTYGFDAEGQRMGTLAYMLALASPAYTSPEFAEWVNPLVPHLRMTPGTTYPLKANPKMETALILAWGRTFLLHARGHYWGGLEALVTAGGGRAPAGTSIRAVRTDTGAVVATGTTDAAGYVLVSPVPGDGAREFRLEEGA